MRYENINKVKELYDKGFRCIRYEEGSQGELVAYFKNFEEEAIDTLVAYDKNEISQIKDFIDAY